MTSTDIIKHLEYQQLTTVGAIKDDKLRKELQNTLKTVINIRDKKVKDFVKIYQIAVNCSYQIKYPILIRHILSETVEEISNDLIKNNKSYRVNFGHETFNYFADQNEAYLKGK